MNNKIELKELFKFEPIDITHIIVTIMIVVIVIYSFKSQLNRFFESLQTRPITVTMSGSETKIELDVPARLELLAESIANPQGTRQQVHDWEDTVGNLNNIEGFQKLGFEDLYQRLDALRPDQIAVINYEVNNPQRNYFHDHSMLKYLSIASQKVKYLAFYQEDKFAAIINIGTVISGLSSGLYEFKDFGDKIKKGAWVNFPGLIKEDFAFQARPSVKELYQYLDSYNISEAPLIEEGKLLGFLNFKSIADELYSQAEKV
ncbi:MAG: hypothetical protein ACI8R9_002628 [Paraglaciecola sp.]